MKVSDLASGDKIQVTVEVTVGNANWSQVNCLCTNAKNPLVLDRDYIRAILNGGGKAVKTVVLTQEEEVLP